MPAESLPDLERGTDKRKLFLFFAVQAIAVAILTNEFKKSGVLSVLLSYGEAWNPWRPQCGWLTEADFVLLSDNVVMPFGVVPGYVHVRGSKIAGINTGGPGADRHKIAEAITKSHQAVRLLDFGSLVVSPGLIDVHVHLNEPGREEWEGMETGTQAAAAGGVTTVIDMPLNSEPCTTTPLQLTKKTALSQGRIHVDMGFWAGLVPQNAHQPPILQQLVKTGALGFKAFMSPSGISDFDEVSVEDIAAAIPAIKNLGVPLLLHAEIVDKNISTQGNPRDYSTWLASRPASFEKTAIRALINLLRTDKSPAKEGFYIHIVHLSDAEMLPEIAIAKAEGLPLSVETCPHYLNFAAEDVPRGDTRYKCAPPLRNRENQARLWMGLYQGAINLLATDHSPSSPDLKRLEDGDFVKAWGGIAGLQYALPATWNFAKQHGLNFTSLADLWSAFPAKLVGLDQSKGKIANGFDADFVVWAPDQMADTSSKGLFHKHKISPYQDKQLLGKVIATFVRGRMVFNSSSGVWDGQPCGRPLLNW